MQAKENFTQKIQEICDQVLEILKVDKKLKFRPMQRRDNKVNTKRSYVIGRTNLRTGLVTIDIFTPRKREPKKISSILRTLCHEIAHHQKKPFKQFYKFRWITRQHYPDFYAQVKENIEILKNDLEIRKYFR